MKENMYVLCSWTYQRPLTQIHHDLMTGFSVYGFSRDTFQYMRSYLTKRNQKV